MNANRGHICDAHQRRKLGRPENCIVGLFHSIQYSTHSISPQSARCRNYAGCKRKIDSWRVHGYVRARHGAAVRARTASGREREQRRKNKGGVPPRERERGWMDMGIRRQSWALGILTAAGLVNGRGGADYRSNVVCQAPSTMRADENKTNQGVIKGVGLHV
jgi:hypothetical protein